MFPVGCLSSMVCFISVTVCPVIHRYIFEEFLRLLIPSISNCDRTAYRTKVSSATSPLFFWFLDKSFVILVFTCGMEFAVLARRELPFYEYARKFCKLAAVTMVDDATLNQLFWLGANYQPTRRLSRLSQARQPWPT